jgi:hypothetical protein
MGATGPVEYLDFEIEIGRARGRVYPVSVLRSPAGETRSEMRLLFTGEGLKVRLTLLESAVPLSGVTRIRKATTPEETPIQALGDTLFSALFTDEVLGCYDSSQRSAREQHAGLRIKLRVQAPELAVLPWEFLYDARHDEYVCLSRRTPLVRHVLTSRPPVPLLVKPPLRILAMVASPLSLPPLDTLTERARLERALHDVIEAGRVELEWISGQTWEALRDALWHNHWHVLHFVGHGSYDSEADEGLLALADEHGNKHLLTATQVAHLLADNDDLRLVVLNACEGARGSDRDLYSGTAARLVTSGGLAAVVAMQYSISDDAAIQFGKQFYTYVARGAPVDAAVAEARLGISVETRGSAEWGTPVLYMQSPDGRIFDIPAEDQTAAQVRQSPPPRPVLMPAAASATKEPTPSPATSESLRREPAPNPPLAPEPAPSPPRANVPVAPAQTVIEQRAASAQKRGAGGLLRWLATTVIILAVLAFVGTCLMASPPSPPRAASTVAPAGGTGPGGQIVPSTSPSSTTTRTATATTTGTPVRPTVALTGTQLPTTPTVAVARTPPTLPKPAASPVAGP